MGYLDLVFFKEYCDRGWRSEAISQRDGSGGKFSLRTEDALFYDSEEIPDVVPVDCVLDGPMHLYKQCIWGSRSHSEAISNRNGSSVLS